MIRPFWAYMAGGVITLGMAFVFGWAMLERHPAVAICGAWFIGTWAPKPTRRS